MLDKSDSNVRCLLFGIKSLIFLLSPTFVYKFLKCFVLKTLKQNNWEFLYKIIFKGLTG